MLNNYKQLKIMLKDIKKYQIYTSISLVFYTGILYALIIQIQRFIDRLTVNNVKSITIDELITILALLIILSIATFLSQYLFNRLPIKAKNIFIGKIYKETLKKSNLFFDKHGESKIYSLISNDAVTFSQMISVNPVVIAYQSITLLLCVILIICTQWILALIILFFVSCCFIFTAFLSKKIAKYNNQVFSEKEEMTKQILDGLENHRVIEILKKNILFSDKFNGFLLNKLQKVELKQAGFNSQYMTIYMLLTVVLPFLSVVLGLYFVSINIMTIGQVLTIYTLTSQLQEPIRQIAAVRTNRDSVMKLSERLSIFLDYDHMPNMKKIDELKSLDFENVSFSYEDLTILNNVNMSIYPSSNHILIEGESGCGKSTLFNLMMNFNSVLGGHIKVNNLDIEKIDMNSYYKDVLYVEQKPVIFKDSLYNNITLYDDFSQEMINEVIDVCQLSDFYLINKDTIIDLKSISGGQAQRISIARILLRKPKLLLLDEPTSALDEKTSINLSSALNTYCNKYKIKLIVISHKKDIMSICEERLILKNGELKYD